MLSQRVWTFWAISATILSSALAVSTYEEDALVAEYDLPGQEYEPYPSYLGAKVAAARMSWGRDPVQCHQTDFSPANSIPLLSSSEEFASWTSETFDFEILYAGFACDDSPSSTDRTFLKAINATMERATEGGDSKPYAWLVRASSCKYVDVVLLAQQSGAKAVLIALNTDFASASSVDPAPPLPFSTTKKNPSVKLNDFVIPSCALNFREGATLLSDVGFAASGALQGAPQGERSIYTKFAKYDQRLYVTGPLQPLKQRRAIPLQIFPTSDDDDVLQSLDLKFLAPAGVIVNIDLVTDRRPNKDQYGLRIASNYVTTIPPALATNPGGDNENDDTLDSLSKLYTSESFEFAPGPDTVNGDIYYVQVSVVGIPGAYAVSEQAFQFFDKDDAYRFEIEDMVNDEVTFTLGNLEESVSWSTFKGGNIIPPGSADLEGGIVSQFGYFITYLLEDGTEFTWQSKTPISNKDGSTVIRFNPSDADRTRMLLPTTYNYITIRGANAIVPVVTRAAIRPIDCDLHLHTFNNLGFLVAAKTEVAVRFTFNAEASAEHMKIMLFQKNSDNQLVLISDITTLTRAEMDATTEYVEGVQVVSRDFTVPDRPDTGYILKLQSYGATKSYKGGCSTQSEYPFKIVSPKIRMKPTLPERVYVGDTVSIEWDATTDTIPSVTVNLLHENAVLQTISPEGGIATSVTQKMEFSIPDSASIIPGPNYQFQVITAKVANSIYRVTTIRFSIVKRGIYHTENAPVVEALSEGYRFRLEWNPDGVAAHTVDAKLLCEYTTEGDRTLSKTYNIRVVGDAPTDAEGVIPTSFLESGHEMTCHFVVQSRANLDYMLEFTETPVTLVAREDFAVGRGGTPNSEGTFTGGNKPSGSGDFGTLLGAFILAGVIVLGILFVFLRYRRRTRERGESELPWDIRDSAATSPRNDNVELQSW